MDCVCCRLIISFLSFSEKSPSGPIRTQVGPLFFFDKILFKLLCSQFISQKIKFPFFGKLSKKFCNLTKLLIFGIEILFDCSADSTIIFLILLVIIEWI